MKIAGKVETTIEIVDSDHYRCAYQCQHIDPTMNRCGLFGSLEYDQITRKFLRAKACCNCFNGIATVQSDVS